MGINITFTGSRMEARRVIRRFVGMLTGMEPDHGRLARGVFLVMGLTVLSDIQLDFLRKSRGGVGEDGVKWKPLSKEYLAYGRRFGRGEKAALKKSAGLGRANSRGVGGNQGLLTAAQQKRWKQIYAQSLAWMAARYSLDQAKAMAAGHAWNVIKKEGAKTMLEVYGSRQVEMLRDTGVLFNSLSPGHLSGNGDYTPGGDNQIMEAIANGVRVGTSVPYAAAQNKQRPFLPEQLPSAWQDRLDRATVAAITRALTLYYYDQGGQAA